MARPSAVGIDLGTTFSGVARVHFNGRTEMIRNTEGDLLTPSVVLFDDQNVVVGKEARQVAVLKVGRIAETVKRDMGSAVYSRPIRGEYLPPEVIQACILRKLKLDIERFVGTDYEVVITVPAFFDEPRRRATAQAGEMADLHVLDIVNEPTAAALAFGEELGYLDASGTAREAATLLVYDLGGGTFDATLVRLEPGRVTTLATDGDVRLGGRDWDLRLVEHAAEQFIREHREDPRQNPASLQKLLHEVEEAKHTLSARGRAKIRIDHAGSSTTVEVAREQFEALTLDLLERTAHTTRQLLADAGLAWTDLNRILLVGGSTRMPMVARMLTELSGLQPDHAVNPDEAVARGAALYANYLLGLGGDKPQNLQVTNVSSHSLGVEGIESRTLSKRNTILIPRNTPLPARTSKEFVTKVSGQTSILVQVLEGESLLPGECTQIGRTVIRGLSPELPQGSPVDVSFEYGVNGRLNVQARVRATGKQASLELERDTALSDSQVNRWKQVIASGGGIDRFAALIEETVKLLDQRSPPHMDVASSGGSQPEAGRPAMPRPELVSPPISKGVAAPEHASVAVAPTVNVIAATTNVVAPAAVMLVPQAPATYVSVSPVAPATLELEADELESPPVRRPRPYRIGPVGMFVSHAMSSIIGISLGYYILCCMAPERFNRFNLPIPVLARQFFQWMNGEGPSDAPSLKPSRGSRRGENGAVHGPKDDRPSDRASGNTQG